MEFRTLVIVQGPPRPATFKTEPIWRVRNYATATQVVFCVINRKLRKPIKDFADTLGAIARRTTLSHEKILCLGTDIS